MAETATEGRPSATRTGPNARRLLLAALLVHLIPIGLGLHRRAFDTPAHLFFADHYRRWWWQTWDPRWYTGFSVTAYPPLVHQLIGVLSRPASVVIGMFAPPALAGVGWNRLAGEEAALSLVLLATVVLFSFCVWEFAAIFAGRRAAYLSALFSIILPAIWLHAYAFGQLPTVLSTSLLMLALARGHRYLRSGDWLCLIQSVALAGTVAAAHHATLLLAAFAGPAVLLDAFQTRPRADRSASSRLWRRGLVWALLSMLAAAAVLWPFLSWGLGYAAQAPIEHPSRDNFLLSASARAVFFWPEYGPLLLVIPFAIGLGLRFRRRLGPLLGLTAALAILGLGGTTPIPRWLFGPNWEWLTYDRFSFWAAVSLLPFAALIYLRLCRAARRWQAGRRAPFRQAEAGLRVAWVLPLALASMLAGLNTVFSQQDLPRLDLQPEAAFLNSEDRSRWRYLTLGFGEQFARLSILSDARTVDGSYHTAREVDALRESGLGALDAAVWSRPGVKALEPILRSSDEWSLRWIFVAHPDYAPVVRDAGFHWRETLSDGVWVFEKDGVPPMVNAAAPLPSSSVENRWWGAAPLAIALLAGIALRAGTGSGGMLGWAQKIGLMSFVFLGQFWYHRVLRPGPEPQVYFTYDAVILFTADLALGFVLFAWTLDRLRRPRRLNLGPVGIRRPGLVFLAIIGLSAIASVDRPLSLWFLALALLLNGLYLYLINDGPGWEWWANVFTAALLVQAAIGLAEVAQQGTGFLGPLGLMWPGELQASQSGAGVVQAGGLRWLRAYGTLPHPNILGGYLLVLMCAPAARFLQTGRWLWLGPWMLGAATLVLSFSRSAWLGAVLATLSGALVYLRLRRNGAGLARAKDGEEAAARRLAALGLSAITVTGAIVLALQPLFAVRLTVAGSPQAPFEAQSSGERAMLVDAALRLWQDRPLLGTGPGTAVEAAARLPQPPVPLEPAHTIPLIVLAETGSLGLLAFLGLMAGMGWQFRRGAGMTMASAALSAALIGIAVTGLLDHYWWTLAPARGLAVLILGLWVAESERSKRPSPGLPVGESPLESTTTR